MSLCPQPGSHVPEETARVARAAFPKGNSYLTLRAELETIYADSFFEDLGDFRERFYCDRVCMPRCSSGYGKPSLFREVILWVCKTQRWNPISLFVRLRSPIYAWQRPK